MHACCFAALEMASINDACKPHLACGFACREKKEYEALEGQIDALSGGKSDLEARLAAAGSDYALMTKLSQELDRIVAEIDAKTERWMELAEIAELAQV